MTDSSLLNAVLRLLLIILIVWILVVGRALILPIVTALLVVYVLHSASFALGRVGGFRLLPETLLQIAVFSGFVFLFLGMATVISSTVQQIIAVAPVYEANLVAMLDRLADRLGLEAHDVWERIETATIDRLDLDALIISLLGGFSSLGGVIFMVVLYAAFLMGERAGFESKIRSAFPEPGKSEHILGVLSKINDNIRTYLAVKTLINVLLAVLSLIVMLTLGVDFALFWAIVIGLLNYIPYVGSYLGVAFPTILSLGQFGDIPYTLLIVTMLTAAQVLVGNILEPKLIGRQMNLSPVVVLIALAFWATLWGVPGAILSVPMTSIIAIILAEFQTTKPIAVLLAARVDNPEGGKANRNEERT